MSPVKLLAAIYVVVATSVTMANAKESDDARIFFGGAQVSLAEAIARGDVPELEYAVQQGADINAPGRHNVTLLYWAVMERSKGGVSFLLAHGADPNKVVDAAADVTLPDILRGSSAIEFAARLDDPWFVKVLADHGGDINLQNSLSRQPPIVAALMSMRTDNVKLLISMGANLNVQDKLGLTPLANAITSQNFELAYEMLQAGADPTIKLNARGITILTLLRRISIPTTFEAQWRLKLIELLHQKGLDVENGK